MKKIFLAAIVAMVLGTSSMFGAVLGVFSYAAKTSGGSLAGQWDYLYNSNYVTYNPQSGYWVTNATHEGEGYTYTIVIANKYSDITNKPIVGLGDDGTLSNTQYTTFLGYPAIAFIHHHDPDANGLFTSFYSYGNTVYSDMNKWLRNP